MPAKGKHRRTRTSTITRGIVAAGTGGAAIALPLMGATNAFAAEQTAPVAAPVVASAATTAPATAPAERVATQVTYRVVAGDYLSKIAQEHRVDGGWQQLYADNRAAVGENPSLIHPGLKLTIGGASAAESKTSESKTSESKTAESKPAAPAKPKAAAEPKQERPAKVEPKQERPAKVETEVKKDDEAPAAQSSAAQTSTAAESASEATGSGWASPLSAVGVSTSYKVSGAMWSSGYHTGIDFAAPTGTTVRSVGPGTVVSAGWSGAYGNEVVIQHTDGKYSQYAHLSSLSVSSGQSVSGGQQIGAVGSTGNSSGPHLHFEIRTSPGYGSDVDPVSYLRQHGVSL
ncbi:LysM peptidoglycan-binding domain-containing M23 family metallopeptidase [Streptomyces sp. NBC_00690]|uniref:LysM peptidoglycan-binding domain-containing M23 family metallopeptidase n=1 Tax=Streptomyces sp. NBC_00690 TaxID=2975808 RepID=UPI002E2CFB99|nr:LysM peptidoglycan-binding domain-containing M23 family metallopeptidase [Streptomyces sp. NBC_00690]